MDPQKLSLLSALGSSTQNGSRQTLRSALLERFENQDAVRTPKMAASPTPHKSRLSPQPVSTHEARSRPDTPTSLLPLLQAPESARSSSSTRSLSESTQSTLSSPPPARMTPSPAPNGVAPSRPGILQTNSIPSFEEYLHGPDSPPPLRVSKSPAQPPVPQQGRTYPPPAPPLRIIEDDDGPLRAAILRNAAYLFPQYDVGELSIATGTTPPDAFSERTAFALVFASELRRAGPGAGAGMAMGTSPAGKPKRVVLELLKGPMGSRSRRRALEGLLVESEGAVGAKVVALAAVREGDVGADVGLGIRGLRVGERGSGDEATAVDGTPEGKGKGGTTENGVERTPVMKGAMMENGHERTPVVKGAPAQARERVVSSGTY